MNKAILLGNVGQDPELKFTQSGKAVLRLRMATNERYKDKGGEWRDRATWHTVTVWGNRAEALNKILSKGSKILVEGRIDHRDWEDKSGNRRTSTEVVAMNIELAGNKPRRGDPTGPVPASTPDDDGFGDDDIPF